MLLDKNRVFRRQSIYEEFYNKHTNLSELQLRIEDLWLRDKHWHTFVMEDRFAHLFDLSKLSLLRTAVKYPRPAHVRTRKSLCIASNRPRGFNQFTGLSRFRMKEFMERGVLPGMYRASW